MEADEKYASQRNNQSKLLLVFLALDSLAFPLSLLLWRVYQLKLHKGDVVLCVY